VISVVIPAFNEELVIGRLLHRLVSSAGSSELDVVVVANGCTDSTAEIAASYGSPVRVLTVAAASKPKALAAGDRVAWGFPRVYLDADVELGTHDLRALGDALRRSGTLAAVPEREFVLAGRPWFIRWYLDVWTRLPEVQRGLFGRGVIAFSAEGHARVTGLDSVVADDLAVSLAFAQDERTVVPTAKVTIYPSKTFADLLRRRVRTAEGIAQLKEINGMPESSSARTSPSALLRLLRGNPCLAPKIAFFLLVAVIARTQARRTIARSDYSSWLRDESSRN
jgi:Glycosyl transferase family 2